MSQTQGTKPAGARPLAHPTLQVIVPVYNAGSDLHQCLAALAASQYDDFGVLVVDDGSTEPVEPLVRAYGFRYMRLDGPGGPARARNYGVMYTSSPYVVFIDADVCVHPHTLAQFAAAFAADATIDAVVGSYDETPAAPNFLSQYKNLFHHGYPRKVGQLGVGHVLYGTEFRHEFSHPTEDRPTWDCGRKAV